MFLLLGGAAAIAGIALLVRNGPSLRRIALLVGGLAALSPAVVVGLWIAVPVLEDMLPRTESWDFSRTRSVSELDPARRMSVNRPDRDSEYYFQGNIRSTIRLPGARQWSGNASLVIVESLGNQVAAIDWQGRNGKTQAVYEQTQRILRELNMPAGELDTWYRKLRAGDSVWFTAESAGIPRVRVDIRKLPGETNAEPVEEREWYVNVHAGWSGGR